MRKSGDSLLLFAYEWFSPSGPVANGIPFVLTPSIHHYEISYYLQEDLPNAYGKLAPLLQHSKVGFINVSTGDVYDFNYQNPVFLPFEPNRDARPLLGKGEAKSPLSFLQYLSTKTLNSLQQGKLKIFIYFAYEGFNLVSSGFLPELHIELEKWNIDPVNVYLVSGNFLERQNYVRWLRENQYTPIAISTFSHFELFSYIQYRQYKQPLRKLPMFANSDSHKTAISAGKKTKSFLCYNRLPKAARWALVTGLFSKNLLKHGLVSFPKLSEFPEVNRDYSTLFDPITHQALLGEISAKSTLLEGQLPLLVDVPDLTPNWAYSEGVDKQAEFAWPYESTYFSIVCETWTDSDRIFLSEKIFKPIMNFHPFIALGNPGTLAQLKNLGYKTFSPLIDESYDLETSFPERLSLILKEVRRLCDMPEKQRQDWFLQLLPILQYNYDNFHNGGPANRFSILMQSIQEDNIRGRKNENWLYWVGKIRNALRRNDGKQARGLRL